MHFYRNKSSIEPVQINAESFRNGLLNEWKACVHFTEDQTNSFVVSHFDRIKEATTFEEVIQLLSAVNSNTCDTYSQSSETVTNSRWKYEIIRKIGEPWNWIYQFVDQFQPHLRSYNFYECQHKFDNRESVESVKDLSFPTIIMPGVGLSVPVETITSFLNYLKRNAMKNDGMVLPMFFNNIDCPPMMHAYL